MNNNLIIKFSIVFVLLLSVQVFADMGPKPTANINFNYNNQPISELFYAKMLSCQNGNGTPNPLYDCENIRDFNSKEICEKFSSINIEDEKRGCYWSVNPMAWVGECKNSWCEFDYFLPDEFKLAIFIPSMNKLFISNEVSRTNFFSEYKINLSPDGSASIIETTSPLKNDNIRSFITALILTLILELFVGYVFTYKLNKYKKILLSIVIANIISLSIVWFVMTFLGVSLIFITLIGSEMFAIIFEAYFIFFLNKKMVSLKKSFIMSISMNLASLIIGGILFIIISLIFGVLFIIS